MQMAGWFRTIYGQRWPSQRAWCFAEAVNRVDLTETETQFEELIT